MQAVILKCQPGYRFHLGEYSERQSTVLSQCADIIHSDVLFGALITNLAKLHPERVNDFKTYFEQGKIRISSAFYCVEKIGVKRNNFVFLLPKPIVASFAQLNENFALDFKKFKKIKYISYGVWQNASSPDQWVDENSEFVMPNVVSVFLKSEIGSEAKFKLSEKVDSLKVRIRTNEEKDNLYSQTDLIMMGNEEKNVHWYFLMENKLEEPDKKILHTCIQELQYGGIGGERSTGCGKIDEVVFEEVDFSVNHSSDKNLLLSLAFPTEENQDSFSYYQTKIRGGMWYGSEKRSKVRRAVEEGAIISKEIKQQVLDLSENGKKYWKYSSNFCLPLPQHLDLNP